MSRRTSSFALLPSMRLALAAALLLPALGARALDDVPDDDEMPAAPAPAEPAPPPTQPAVPAPEPAPGPVPEPEPEPVELPPAGEPEAAPSERPVSGIWKGRHRLQLVAGYQLGMTVRDAGILTAPITGQPGSLSFPALTALKADLDGSPVFGLRYAWFAGDDWGFEVSLEHAASEVHDPEADLQAEIDFLNGPQVTLSAEAKQALIDRLTAHKEPHDLDVTFLDLGALHVFNPRQRWPIEIGGGIGWAFSSLEGPVAYERLVSSVVLPDFPNDPVVIANDIVLPAPPHGQCLADNDPCIELRERDGLTWHASLGVGYAFTPAAHLRFGTKLRYVEQLVDPGDSNVLTEFTLGLSFQFGGQ